jgi:hypothetical protein
MIAPVATLELLVHRRLPGLLLRKDVSPDHQPDGVLILGLASHHSRGKDGNHDQQKDGVDSPPTYEGVAVLNLMHE